jgi:hypothetical protein
MLRIPIKILLFLSSYIPLYILLIVRNYEEIGFSLGLGIFSLVLGCLIFLILGRISQIGGEYKKIEDIEDATKVNLEYFVAYVIPFLTDDFFGFENALSFLIVFFIIGVIYIKSDLIYVNPILVLARYNVFKVRIEGKEQFIVTRYKKAELRPTEEVIELGDNVFLVHKHEARRDRTRDDRQGDQVS